MAVAAVILLMGVYTFLWMNAQARLILTLCAIGAALGYAAWTTVRAKRTQPQQKATGTSLAEANVELGISAQDGSIRLPNGGRIFAGLTQDAFLASEMGRAAGGATDNPPWAHYRLPGGAVDGKPMRVSACFSGQMLCSVDLAADLYPPGPKSWGSYSLKTEAATKDFHDRLLRHLFDASTRRGQFHVAKPSEDEAILDRPVQFPFAWGAVTSTHDSRGGGTSITVVYGNRLAEAASAARPMAPKRQGEIEELLSQPGLAASLLAAKRELGFGKRTEAIRLLRQATGMGLREAEDVVASWEKG